jgi:hypothetical protein
VLADRTRPLKERLTYFYREYARTAMGYERVRLFILAGLEGGLDLNARFFEMLHERVFTAVLREVRHVYDLPSLDERPMSEIEAEMVWMLHSAIFYIGIRRWIYGMSVPETMDPVIEAMIATFLDGAPKEMVALAGPKRP